jgi:tryptophan 2-monooxygenase
MLQDGYFQFQTALNPTSDRGVYLAGDSISWYGGWIEGALQTGINAACAAAKRLRGTVRENSPLTQKADRYFYGGRRPAS